MIYNGIWFNAEWAKTKTEAEFVKHEGHHGLTVEQLKEVYAMLVPAKKEKVTAPAADSNGK